MNETSGTTGSGIGPAETPRPDESEPNGGAAVNGTTPAGASADEMTKVRDLVLRAHPDVVPDLVRGNSVDELIASVEPARSAYQAVAERVRAGQSGTASTGTTASTAASSAAGAAVTQPPSVPAGGARAQAVNLADLPPADKIARALAERRRG